MVEAVNLTKRFDDIVTVDHMSIAMRDGSVFGLIGANGAGKSASLRLTDGVSKLDEGCITTNGHKVFENIPVEKRFFYISNKQYFFNNTAPEEMTRYYRKIYQEFDEARFHKLMGNFGLDEKREVHTFSKGMKKQVSVICGVCAGTDYLFCGETFDGLDPVMHQAVKSIFAADMEDRDSTPIIASRNLRKLEGMCDHVGLLYKGGILLLKDSNDMKLDIHKIQCVLEPDIKPEDLTSLDRVNVEQRGSLYTITARENRGKVEAVMASYEPIFFKCTPLSLEEIFISETGVVGYDIRKLIL